jgi:predicted nucleotidyltransferase
MKNRGGFMKISEITEQIIQICRNHHAKTVILFGSRSKGTATLRSDIDIAVSGAMDIDGLDTCKNELLLEDIKQYGRKIYEEI